MRGVYELEKYYQVGKLLIEAQGGENRAKYVNSFIIAYCSNKRIQYYLYIGIKKIEAMLLFQNPG